LSKKDLIIFPHGMWNALPSILFSCVTMRLMKKIHVLFHDAGGGHRNAAVALQTVVLQQNRNWELNLIQFQDLTNNRRSLNGKSFYVGASNYQSRVPKTRVDDPKYLATPHFKAGKLKDVQEAWIKLNAEASWNPANAPSPTAAAGAASNSSKAGP
jgi:hypothetical protein